LNINTIFDEKFLVVKANKPDIVRKYSLQQYQCTSLGSISIMNIFSKVALKGCARALKTDTGEKRLYPIGLHHCIVSFSLNPMTYSIKMTICKGSFYQYSTTILDPYNDQIIVKYTQGILAIMGSKQ
jgi:hypothetical protein